MKGEGEADNSTVEGKIDEAQKLKLAGNEHFKNKEYPKALRCYHQGLLYIEGLVDKDSPMAAYSGKTISEAASQQIKSLKFSLWMNMAQIYINQSKFDKGK